MKKVHGVNDEALLLGKKYRLVERVSRCLCGCVRVFLCLAAMRVEKIITLENLKVGT